jgi:hypothetical protein
MPTSGLNTGYGGTPTPATMLFHQEQNKETIS